MLSKNLYRMKKRPLTDKRKKAVFAAVLAGSLFFVGAGAYLLNKTKPASGQKDTIVLETGDRPLKKELTIYVNADGGLSLRGDHDSTAARLELIPDKTSLAVTEELDGWYQVTYNGKTGWVSKQYTTAVAPAADPTKDWATFAGQGYKIKYQAGWKAQDYGANSALSASSLVAFSNQDLPAALPAGSEFIAPVTVAVSTKAIAEAESAYATIAGAQTEPVTIAASTGKKFTYTATGSNTQVTVIVLAAGGKVFVFSEGGGYADDLLKMSATFTIG